MYNTFVFFSQKVGEGHFWRDQDRYSIHLEIVTLEIVTISYIVTLGAIPGVFISEKLEIVTN